MPIISDAELARRRKEILDASRACFAKYGFEGATVARLEKATGKTRGAIFHHFVDKETLFLAIASEDAERQAEVVSRQGLVEVMHDLLQHPEENDWFVTRSEIVRKLRTDPAFEARWRKHQEVLDEAVRKRLESNTAMRQDVPIEVMQTYLETVLEGFIIKLAAGEPPEQLEAMLDVVEQSVRSSVSS
ncbi:TetR family transcriptional regulator [Corynebacterium sp. NML98-0116]|uniref:TetR/AcrR family transcriptional regulator n=2 Tax=Corynebacterium TaxID=1716 RepID=A0ABD4TLJ2_9CORY|nr:MULTISPECIES: TetR/AcrR family transcriptional regulator [Corynebacterium]AOX05579.1 TetR family transcriptional regulator [Corynebacterium sp. NML98-0116]MCO6393691.1 TetR/AcrR family transcriptional regulator [Corynebacterium lipophilum]MCQ4609175.1 TetR/AcrR family transcriptional regulator [Corynebacterium sp. CCUG 61414]MCQ4611270.1 TetR/AcrR family transcriptional regulator [Corynebacterium sp. CCUG 51687]MCQ4613212.1 TetR/AcrR family transcriptional regulator [Corynebacterium pseudog